ncbi:MAG: hypothetical protein ACU0DI_12300 [Paracoccaceae bacterium]
MRNNKLNLVALLAISLTILVAQKGLSQDIAPTTLPHTISAGAPISSSGLNSNFEFLLQRIGELEARMESVQASFPDITMVSARAIFGTLDGAVVAFDGSKSKEGCPPGWTLFSPAAGRFVVGAGVHRNEDGSGVLLQAREQGSTGGEEMHTITAAELPSHLHSYRSTDNGPLLDNGSNFIGGAGRFGVVGDKNTSSVGENAPLNNMPPFIALYFCQFQGQ